MRNESSMLGGVILAIVGVMLAIVIGFGSIFTVDQGERGVVLRNGAFVSVAGPGMGFKIPFVDSVKYISVREQIAPYENVQAYSKDQQTGTMKVSITYQVPEGSVEDVYANYGSLENLVVKVMDPKVNKTLEEVFGHFDAVTAVQDRARLGSEFYDAIQNSVKGPIVIKSVQVENIDFSQAYEDAVAAKTKAEVAIKTAENDAKKAQVDATVGVINAEAAAKAQIAKATAAAETTRLNGEAEAYAITARAKALGSNPNLIALTMAERWDGKLPVSMVPGGAVPFLNITQ